MKNRKSNDGIVMKIYKMERCLYNHHLKIMSNIIFRLIYLVFNCYIPPSVEIGDGTCIPHGIGIVIHHTAKIGSDCKIYQNVTIGGADGARIGNNCVLGANVVIYGKVLNGDNVKIGANTFVNFDVENDRTVVGEKGHIIGND